MEWNEVRIYTTTEGIEPVSAVLMESGINGIMIEDDDDLKNFMKTDSEYWDYIDENLLNKPKEETKIKFYVSANPAGHEQYINAKAAVKRLKDMDIGLDLGRLETEISEDLDDREWLEKWKEFYKPFNVGKKILIKPVWENVDNKDNRIVFNINPGHVFGTGLHQSTQLCIKQLEKYVNGDTIMADLGCGSGILSIISLLLGAEYAFAVDIDSNAVKTAYENAALNGITDKSRYHVESGNVVNDEALCERIGYGKYDVVAANIIADVICAISPIVPKFLKPNGIFISSGIIKERADDVKEALIQNSLKIIDISSDGEWVAITAGNGVLAV